MEQIAPPSTEQRPYGRYFAPRFLVLIVGIGLSITCFFYLSAAESDNAFSHIKSQNKQRALAIASSANDRLVVLKSLRSHAQHQESFTKADFTRLAGVFLSHYSDILAIEWSPRIPDAFRKDFEASMQTSGANNYQILQYEPAKDATPSPQKPIYFPIQYVMPNVQRQAAIGLDISSIDHWQDLLEKAESQNAPVASSMTTIKTGDDTQTTIRIFYPVFDNEKRTKGYLSMVIKMGSFITHALQGHRKKEIITELYDLGQHSKLPIYAWSDPQQRKDPLNSEGPFFRETIPFADRQWLAVSQPSSIYLKLHRSAAPRNMLLAGLFLTTLAYISLHWSYLIRRKLFIANSQLEQKIDTDNKTLENKIIEKRVLERALSDSEQRCRDLILLSHDYTWESNIDYEYTYLSPQAAKVMGLPPKQLAGISLLACLIDEDRDRTKAELDSSYKNQTHVELEVSFTMPKGEPALILIRALPLMNELGECVGFRGTGHQIS